ncbi:photosynthetic reaction center subunit H [Rhodospirillum rubrum]|uniref:photosynthetic reaction center subunit H n=1 Tax=Rhodospirillum rubrum TaxID=1085 RepID=UPI001907660D|nr:photosynthetic reaction center subunit H [Rhodospirillum rubrum]MBK1665991.1 photosynthetic reaction center subunit H [Rhodospirillum rubrum]MBK1677971.1 photosynthetic reaction center subunit H [Rhodospirillum rubrum]
MNKGDITGYMDVAQVVLYAFWIFFAGLIIYLRREDRREGYPLEDAISGKINSLQGLGSVFSIARPKIFKLQTGATYAAPNFKRDAVAIKATRTASTAGAPFEPTGNPMTDAVGPAAYALRDELPDLTLGGQPAIVPLRAAPTFSVAAEDTDPRGLSVVDRKGAVAGKVTDLWIDRASIAIRYLEVELAATPGRKVLLPFAATRINAKTNSKTVTVQSILARHFANVPTIAKTDSITRREEDKVMAYYSSGYLYSDRV